MEITDKLKETELLSIFTKHYPNKNVVNVEDLSNGCDNWIFCLTFANNDQDKVLTDLTDKVIMRFPRKLADPDCPKMHQPKFQAYILEVLDKNLIPGPKLLHLSSNYLIESYLEGKDLSKVEIKDENQLKRVLTQMGSYVKKLHSIDCCQRFGYIVDIDSNRHKLIGKYDNWLEMFENEFPVHLKECLTKNLIDQNMFELLDQFYTEVKPQLKAFSEPKLLHSDICANNTRVLFNSIENSYELNGLVDFADCMSGDPMFDLGELLISYFGDYSVIDMFECGYGVLSTLNKSMIRFYAIHYNLWLLSGSVLTEDINKWFNAIKKLSVLKF